MGARKAQIPAGVRSDGRTNGRTLRTGGSQRNDTLEKQKRQLPKQIYFSAFSKLQEIQSRDPNPSSASVRMDERTIRWERLTLDRTKRRTDVPGIKPSNMRARRTEGTDEWTDQRTHERGVATQKRKSQEQICFGGVQLNKQTNGRMI